jgi:hypothetical protein
MKAVNQFIQTIANSQHSVQYMDWAGIVAAAVLPPSA